MKRKLLLIGLAGVFLIAFYLYAVMPRDNQTLQDYIDYLIEEDLLTEDGAIYQVEYEQNGRRLTTWFLLGQTVGTLNQQAASAMRQLAETERITLPDGFEEGLAIQKLTLLEEEWNE